MENQENWNSEKKRLERKKRLEGLKSRDGKKPPVESSGKAWRILKPVISIVVILALGIWLSLQFALPNRIFPPMSVNGENISDVEFKFYYSNTLSQMGIDPTTAEGKEALKTPTGMEGYEDMTWHEYAVDMAANTIFEFHVQYMLAKEAGLELTDEDLKEIDDIFDNLIAELGGTVEADRYLVELFGKNVTVRTLKPVFEKQTLASKYAMKYIEDMDISEEKVLEFYSENKNDFESVSFRIEYFEIEFDPEASEEENDQFEEDAMEKAQDFLEQATDADAFRLMSKERAEQAQQRRYEEMDEEAREEYDLEKEAEEKAKQEMYDTMTEEEIAEYEKSVENADRTLIEYMRKENFEQVSIEMGNWLFDEEREYADTQAFISGSGIYATYFVSRNTYEQYPSARHILISPNEEKDVREGDIFTAEEWENAREKAKDVLEQVTSLEKFIELVEQHSSDPGSVENEGLYEDIQRNQMMPQFNDWVFDPSREEGDTGIVRTDYGFHIMWFEGMQRYDVFEENKENIRMMLAEESYSEHMDAIIDSGDYSYELSSLGIRLIA